MVRFFYCFVTVGDVIHCTILLHNQPRYGAFALSLHNQPRDEAHVQKQGHAMVVMFDSYYVNSQPQMMFRMYLR